jgi:hypothetical protein
MDVLFVIYYNSDLLRRLEWVWAMPGQEERRTLQHLRKSHLKEVLLPRVNSKPRDIDKSYPRDKARDCIEGR